jgi:hypothetical protein
VVPAPAAGTGAAAAVALLLQQQLCERPPRDDGSSAQARIVLKNGDMNSGDSDQRDDREPVSAWEGEVGGGLGEERFAADDLGEDVG